MVCNRKLVPVPVSHAATRTEQHWYDGSIVVQTEVRLDDEISTKTCQAAGAMTVRHDVIERKGASA